MNFGWNDPIELTDEVCSLIRAELNKRTDHIFHDETKQDWFIRRVKGALCAVPKPHERMVPRASLDRLEKHAAARESGKQSRINKTYKALGEDELGLIELASKTKNNNPVRLAANSLKLLPSQKYGTPEENATRLITHLLADGYFNVFNKRPSYSENGAYFQIINVVLVLLNLPEIGPEMLKTILQRIFKYD